jgi:hypothetical protein
LTPTGAYVILARIFVFEDWNHGKILVLKDIAVREVNIDES